jgi:hypothetical protein
MNDNTSPGAQIFPFAQRGHEDAAGTAIRWLSDRHRKAWRTAFEGLLDLWRPENEPDAEFGLDEDLMQMVSVNAGEWLLSRGEMLVKGEMRSINAHVLGRDGPFLNPGQQAWITQLGVRPLRLYRVTDVRPGVGLTLVDALETEADPIDVQERSGSATARPGMLMGARVMHLDTHNELSGAIYGFAVLAEHRVIEQVRAALSAGLEASNTRTLAELSIAQTWLAQWFEPMPVPDLRDASTGEPMLLITDHYRVTNPAALAAALAAQPDVYGDPQVGWHRDISGDDGVVRSLVAINPGKAADRIELFYRTQRLADDGRTWFDALAGDAVKHLTREVTDPRSATARAGASKKAPKAPALDPAEMTAAMTQVLHRHYAHWADEPVPLLDNKTPREAMKTPAGLERVKGLLRYYEAGEAEMARADGREPVSYQFLWDSLGIER